MLHSANLGDSGFMVIRGGKLIFESPSQQHSFNFPYQIGSYGDPISSCEVRTPAPSLCLQACVLFAGSARHAGHMWPPRTGAVTLRGHKAAPTPAVPVTRLLAVSPPWH